MAELATIARPYAEAVFQATKTDLDNASIWIQELAAIASNEELKLLVANPNYTQQQMFDLIMGVAVASRQSEQAQAMLRVVLENKRLSVLPEIADQFSVLKNKYAGNSDAVIYTAYPIDEAALKELGAQLEVKFQRKLILRVEIDTELIAGIRVIVGDEVLDTSVKARLEQMQATLVV